MLCVYLPENKEKKIAFNYDKINNKQYVNFAMFV